MPVEETDSKQVWRWKSGKDPCYETDELAKEEPLEIRVNGRPVSVTMRTPGHDEELAVGFLLAEGLIQTQGDAVKVLHRPNCNIISVILAPDLSFNFDQLTRHVFASSSCGLCGKATIDAVQQNFAPVQSDLLVEAETLLELPNRLRQTQTGFDQSGGLHAAAIFDTQGKLLVLREDVGRHNAVDKVLGYGLQNDLLPFERHILMVSGRTSFEILQKALAAKIPIVAAVSAPSTLAVEFADQSRQTLIGFLRSPRMNIYTQPQRIHFGKRA